MPRSTTFRRITCLTMAAATMFAAASCAEPTAPGPNAAASLATVPDDTVITSPTTTPTAPVPTAPATTMPASTTPMETDTESSLGRPPICIECLEISNVVAVSDYETRFTLRDASPRTADTGPRTMYVRVFLPTNPATDIHVEGSYHRDGVASGGQQFELARPEHTAVIIVGFDTMPEGAPQFGDLANTPKDVSAVLDVLSVRDDIVGRLPMDKILYTGGSLGAVVGWLFTNDCCIDPRIDVMLLSSGFRLDEQSGFGMADRYNVSAAPPVLAVHGTDDDVIPYDWFHRTAVNSAAPHMEFITVVGAGHSGLTDCPGVLAYELGFVAAVLHDAPRPVFDADSCAVFGLVDDK